MDKQHQNFSSHLHVWQVLSVFLALILSAFYGHVYYLFIFLLNVFSWFNSVCSAQVLLAVVVMVVISIPRNMALLLHTSRIYKHPRLQMS